MLKKAVLLLSLFALAVFAAEPAAPAAKLDYRKLVIPTLKPAGSGNMANSVIHYMLRGQQVLFFCVKDGETIQTVVKHMGNRKRSQSISYVFLDQQKKVLKEGIITFGKLETLSYKVEKGGTYALVINSGKGASPWYTIASKTPFTALTATKEVYLFSAQEIYAPGKLLGNNDLQVTTTPAESYEYSIDGGEKVELITPKTVKIPMPEKAVVKIKFARVSRPLEIKSWCQNFMLSFPGCQSPFIFFGPDRAVEIVK